MNSPFHIYQLSIHFLPFCSYTNTKTLYIITKTPGGFPWLYGQFPCLYKGFACGYRAALCTHLFHLPERASHSPDKAPLALHIGFQIFRALPVCLPDCFRVIKLCFLPQKHIVLKFSRHLPGIFQPRKVRAHRTSHQNILFKVHGKPIAFEHFLLNPLKAHRGTMSRKSTS